ncbi:MAG: hypothetical protein ABI366_11440 [Ginsengibacter sp.]
MESKSKSTKSALKRLKYLPKMGTAFIFLILLVAAYLLFAGRKSDALQSGWILMHLPDFYIHVSNFTLSYILYASIGYVWLLIGIDLKKIIILGIIIIAINFIFELWIPVLNTRDVVDAYYGCVGTAFGFFFLFITKKLGLRPNITVEK